jgi:hypothetical protein
LIDKEIVNIKVSTTSVSLLITQYKFNNSVENEKKIKTLQVLEICIKNKKKFSKDEHFWTFLKTNISLAMHPNFVINQQETINKSEFIVWLYNSKITTTIETFKSSIEKLNKDMNGALLLIRNTYQISCELLCIFWYLQFKQMDQFTKVLQNILGKSKWTFKYLSNIFIRNFRLKLKRKRSVLQNEPITMFVELIA